MAAPMISDPITKLQCSPTSDGAGCAIVASERYVDAHGLWDRAIEIAGQAMATDLNGCPAKRSAKCGVQPPAASKPQLDGASGATSTPCPWVRALTRSTTDSVL